MENPEIKLVLVLILSFVYFGLHLKKIMLIACIFKICCDIQLLISLLAKAELSPFEREWEPKFQAYKEDLKSLLRLNGNCYTCFPPKIGFDCKYQIKFPFNFSPFDCTPNK